MVTADDVLSGGTTSSKLSAGMEAPKPQTPAYQPQQQTTNQTANPTAKQEQTKGNVTPVNADDDFLNGFNSIYEDELPATSNTPQQTVTPIVTPSTWSVEQKELRRKGITETTDYFLDGFYRDDENEQIVEQNQLVLRGKKGSPTSAYSGYTGAWEAVQPDTAGSGFQIHARPETPVPQTEEDLQTAYEKTKAYYDSIIEEMDRTARESGVNTQWYEALNREQERVWKEYSVLKEQYEQQFPNNRVWGIIAGSGMDYAGQLISSAGALIEGMTKYVPMIWQADGASFLMQPTAEQDISLVQEYITNDMRDFGENLSDKGETMVQDQKKGLGKFGQFAVDLGSAATQMVLDIGFGVATGGGMAIPAAIRTFGDSAAEAREDGASLEEQMLYATTSAALSYGVEQLCNVAFKGLSFIAPGVTDDVITAGVENLAQKLASTPKGAEALKNIGMLIASGAGEGVEETLESILNPFLQRLSYNQNAETVFQNPKLLNSALYDGVVGGILGMFGSGTNTAVDVVENLINNKTMPGEKLMEAAGVSESEVLGAMAINEMAKMDDVNGSSAQSQNYNPLDETLLTELALSGEKHNPDDIVAITKSYENKLVWLENGTDRAGLNHIVGEHANDFEKQGVLRKDLPRYIMSAIESGKIIGYQGRGTGRPIYEFVYNGEVCRIAITVSENGFIVGANPK